MVFTNELERARNNVVCEMAVRFGIMMNDAILEEVRAGAALATYNQLSAQLRNNILS